MVVASPLPLRRSSASLDLARMSLTRSNALSMDMDDIEVIFLGSGCSGTTPVVKVHIPLVTARVADQQEQCLIDPDQSCRACRDTSNEGSKSRRRNTSVIVRLTDKTDGTRRCVQARRAGVRSLKPLRTILVDCGKVRPLPYDSWQG